MKSADASVINELVEWCIMSWYHIASRISTDRVVFDLCQEYDKFVNSDFAKSDDGFQSSHLLPLHELIPLQDSSATSAIGTLLIFKRAQALLSPTSKIQFYSDPQKVNLVNQITAGTEGKKDLPPLLLNYGQIWVNVDPGTTALLPKHV